MKIKCPFCDKDKYTATKQLDLHVEHYHLLIEKIHETLAEVVKSKEYYTNVKKYETNSEDYAIELLESLLEDKK